MVRPVVRETGKTSRSTLMLLPRFCALARGGAIAPSINTVSTVTKTRADILFMGASFVHHVRAALLRWGTPGSEHAADSARSPARADGKTAVAGGDYARIRTAVQAQ